MWLKPLGLYILAHLAFARYFIVGPAELKVVSFQSCPDQPNLPMRVEVKPHMFNKTTQIFDGFFNIPLDITDNVTVTLKASRVDKHKTQVNSFVLTDVPACQALIKYVGDLWFDIERQIGMEPGVCPIKMGNYSIQNGKLDLSKLSVQMLLEGQFKTKVNFKNNTKTIACIDVDLILSPKNH